MVVPSGAMLDVSELAFRLMSALAIGLLIGAERERRAGSACDGHAVALPLVAELRARGAHAERCVLAFHYVLRRRLARTLEAESGFNDPVAILLVLGFIDWIRKPGYGAADMALLFAQELVIGAAVGAAVGWLAIRGIRLSTAR